MIRRKFLDLSQGISLATLCLPALLTTACAGNMNTDTSGGSEGASMTGGEDITKGKMIGIKVYDKPEAEEFDTWDKVFDAWEAMGVNTVYTIPETAVDEEFAEAVKSHDMQLYLILQVFFYYDVHKEEPELCAINSEGECAVDDWVSFACPSRETYRQRKIEQIEEWVKDIKPDGISIDFIRHFQFWEKVYPEAEVDELVNTCFDDACMSRFQKDTEIKIPDYDPEASEKNAAWIADNNMDEWVDWKVSLITSMVEEIVERTKAIDKDLATNVHLVPWRQDDWDGAILSVIGQDFGAIAKLVDYVSPMAYSHMLHREPEWIASVLEDVHDQVGDDAKIVPSVQVDQYEEYGDPEMSSGDFQKIMQEAMKEPSEGVIWFNWPLFEANEGRRKAVRKYMLGLE